MNKDLTPSHEEPLNDVEYEERALNEAAYRRLRDFIRENYPHGRFVGIAGGKIVADAGSFRELREMLNQMGLTSRDNFVVEAGVEYPEFMIILSLVGFTWPCPNSGLSRT